MKRKSFTLVTVLVVLLMMSQIAFAQFGHYAYSIVCNSTGNPIVAAREYMWRFDGSTWSKINLLSGGMPTYPTVAYFRPTVRNGSTIYQFDHTFVQDNYLWKSTDDGFTWNYIQPTGLPSEYPLCLTLDKDDNLLVGTMKGIWKSTNSGASWNLLGAQNVVGLDNLQIRSLAIHTTSIYAGTNQGIYKSTDNGVNWTKLSGLSNVSILSIAIHSNGNVFTGTGTGGLGCYRSTDGGASWTNVLNVGEFRRMFVTIVNSGTLFVAGLDGDGIYRSTNNGDSWETANTGLLTDVPYGLEVRTITEGTTGTLYAGTTTDGIFKSTDNGTNWEQIGIPTKVGVTVTKSPYIFSSGNGYLFRSTNSGTSWKRVGIQGGTNAILVGSENNIFAGSGLGLGIFKSTDNGAIWTQISVPSEMNYVYSFAKNSSNKIFAGTDAHGIYSSTDQGVTWEVSQNSTNQVISLTVSPKSSRQYVYAGTAALVPGGIFRSIDDGTTWTKPSTALDVFTITSLVVDSKEIVYVGTANGVYKSTDFGVTWNLSSGKQQTSTFTNVTCLTVADTLLYASTAGFGLYKSTDGGITWESVNDIGLSKSLSAQKSLDTHIYSVAVDDSFYLYAGTSMGVVRSANPVVSTPSIPNLVFPGNGMNELPKIITFIWGAPVGTSQLQISNNSGFTEIILDSSEISVNAFTTTLNAATQYFWRVRAKNGVGTSDWSFVWNFRTTYKPESPIVIQPIGTQEDGFATQFLWHKAERANWYTLQIFRLIGETPVVIFDSTLVDTNVVLIKKLPLGYNLFWQVSGENDSGTGQWSSFTPFSTKQFTILERQGWNLTSVPITKTGTKSELFPSAISHAYTYQNGYVQKTTLENGIGYWLKFDASTPVNFSGYGSFLDTVDVKLGWNMIGSITDSVLTSSITTIPDGIISSNFYEYKGGYFTPDKITPGGGYWIKVNHDGILILNGSNKRK